MAKDFSYVVAEEWLSGQFKRWMNDEWYGILLRLIRDCGYDTSSVENPNWKKIENVAPFFTKIEVDLEHRIYGSASVEGTRETLYIDQLIMDV